MRYFVLLSFLLAGCAKAPKVGDCFVEKSGEGLLYLKVVDQVNKSFVLISLNGPLKDMAMTIPPVSNLETMESINCSIVSKTLEITDKFIKTLKEKK